MKRMLLVCLLLTCASAYQAWAQRSVTGKVTDDSGEGLPGVNVVVKGTTSGTITDLDGNYTLSVQGDDATLVYSFIGFETKEIPVGARSVLDTSLDPDVTELTEVVVTALGISKEKRALGYSVQQVDGDQVAQSRETNIINGLQGQIAGVQIAGSAGGAIGGSSRITIRGSNSFTGNNQPLFVVDGVPMDNGNYASTSQARGFGTGSGQYDYGNNISDINPNDIESINVLKGTAASALYGVRGANGVIFITTKNGKGKKGIGVTVNSATTFDRVNNLIPHQTVYGGGSTFSTASGFLEFTQDGQDYLAPQYSKDGSWGPKFDESVMVRHWDSWDPNNPETYKQTRPWVAPENSYEEYFETGVTMTNSVGLSGGNDNGNFRMAYTRVDQAGVMPESGLTRNTFAFNAGYNFTDRLRANASANYVEQSTEGRSITGYNNGNPMQAFTQWWQTNLDVTRMRDYLKEDGTQYTWNPVGPVVNDEGQLVEFDDRPNFFDNPYFTRNEFLQEDERNRLFGFYELSYDLTDFLTLSGKVMRDGMTQRFYEGVPVGSVDQSSYSETVRTRNENNFDARLAFNQAFGDFTIDAILGANLMRQQQTYTRVSTTGGLSLPGFFNLSNSAGALQYDVSDVRPALYEEEIRSVYLTTTFGYQNTIFIDASLRNDASSTLPEEENPFQYYSFTGSYVFSELPALSSSVLSFGKVRVGYGTAANDPGAYSLNQTYVPVVPNYGSFARYEVPDAANNPGLRPEFTTEFEAGIEMIFFNDRVGLDVTYYDRKTTDQIFSVDLSPASGNTSKVVNAGTMTNSGFEIMLNLVPLRIADFEWAINANFATYNNEVVELREGTETLNFGSTWAAELRVQEGLPYMALFGTDFLRNEDGDILVNADGTPQGTTDERVYLGSAIADFTGGVRNTFSWKGLSLSGLIDFQKGGVIHSTSLQWAQYSGMTDNTVFQNGRDIRAEGYIVPGVTEEGTENTTPMDAQTYFQSYWNVATPNVYNAGFLKLREVSLSYRLPSRILSNTPFQDVSVGIFGRNLAILSADLPHLDPQIVTGSGNIQGLENAQVPSTRSIGFNVGLKF